MQGLLLLVHFAWLQQAGDGGESGSLKGCRLWVKDVAKDFPKRVTQMRDWKTGNKEK